MRPVTNLIMVVGRMRVPTQIQESGVSWVTVVVAGFSASRGGPNERLQHQAVNEARRTPVLAIEVDDGVSVLVNVDTNVAALRNTLTAAALMRSTERTRPASETS